MTAQTQQFQYEHDTWKRVLYHMMDENVHFKLRLSEILKSRSDKKFIAKAELFQHRFIKFDEHLFKLRNQLVTLEKNINNGAAEEIIMELKLSFETLRKHMASAERQLIRSRINFICYLNKISNADPIRNVLSGLNKEVLSGMNESE